MYGVIPMRDQIKRTIAIVLAVFSVFANTSSALALESDVSAKTNGSEPYETADTPETEDTPDKAEEKRETADSPFAAVTGISKLPKMGDPDDDGKVTSSDSLLILRASIGINEEHTDRYYAGDVDGDLSLTSADSLCTLRKSVGLEQIFPNESLENVKWYKDSTAHYAQTQDGEVVTGIVVIDGYKCGFDAAGKLLTGDAVVGGKEYHFLENGILMDGWQDSEEGRSYYSDGEIPDGWNTIYGLKCYFDNGHAVSGWKTMNGIKMHFDENGVAAIGLRTIGGKQFYFGNDCEAKSGLLTISGKTYYMYSQGGYAKGWKTVGEKRFYFNESGAAVKGFTEIEGQTYYFDDSNVMQIGWITQDGKKYYFTDDGFAAIGEYPVDDRMYNFSDTGELLTGIQTISDKVYYFDDYGFKQYGWQLIGDKKYYFGEDGAAIADSLEIDGIEYLFGSDGVLKNGWINNNGYKSYLSKNEIVTGEQVIDGKKYKFSEDGLLITGFYRLDGAAHRNNAYGYPVQGHWSSYRLGSGTVCSELGIDGYEYYKWLVNHDGTLENDVDNDIDNRDYYIGTPYKGYDHRNPKGDCAGAYGIRDTAGVASMNCTGFVWHVLMNAGLNSGKTLEWAYAGIPTMGDYYNGKRTNGIEWVGPWLRTNSNIEYYYYGPDKFSTLTQAADTAVQDGVLEYGDIIFLKTTYDGHVGIYSGDGTVNEWWDSSEDDLGCNKWGDKIDLEYGTFKYLYVIKGGASQTK